jgi:hypothetical protein
MTPPTAATPNPARPSGVQGYWPRPAGAVAAGPASPGATGGAGTPAPACPGGGGGGTGTGALAVGPPSLTYEVHAPPSQ